MHTGGDVIYWITEIVVIFSLIFSLRVKNIYILCFKRLYDYKREFYQRYLRTMINNVRNILKTNSLFRLEVKLREFPIVYFFKFKNMLEPNS